MSVCCLLAGCRVRVYCCIPQKQQLTRALPGQIGDLTFLLGFALFVHQAGGFDSSSIPLSCNKQPRVPSSSVPSEEESFRVNLLRVRAKDAECRLQVVEANLAVLKSKQAAFVDRENFLLSELRQLSDHLLCKFYLCLLPYRLC